MLHNPSSLETIKLFSTEEIGSSQRWKELRVVTAIIDCQLECIKNCLSSGETDQRLKVEIPADIMAGTGAKCKKQEGILHSANLVGTGSNSRESVPSWFIVNLFKHSTVCKNIVLCDTIPGVQESIIT